MKDPTVFNVRAGSIALLTAPGLGIEIDEELVRKEADEMRDQPKFQNPDPRGEDGGIVEW